VLELLRGSGGLDPSIAQASYGMVEHRSPFRCVSGNVTMRPHP
jgi:hypothetical protein